MVILAMSSAAAAATRPPAVAGSFYPGGAAELRAEVAALLAAAPARAPSRALVVPHAGYAYSGAVAAEAFATLDAATTERVILLGPSHHQSFAGGALPGPGIEAFATPLGAVALDRTALERLRGLPDFAGPARAHDPEHCLEVELPFLQLAAPRARIVPVLVGAGTTAETARRMAKALAPLLDERTAVVVSSDFSHHGERYRWAPFSGPDLGDQLLRLGRLTAGRLAAIDPVGFSRQIEVSGDTVCGARPAMILVELAARAFAGEGEVLEVTTSGHRSGDWSLSVTYAAVAYRGRWTAWREPRPAPPLAVLSAAEGAAVAALARAVLESHLRHDGSVAAWHAAHPGFEPALAQAGAFVTLHHRGMAAGAPGRLRACMGLIEATEPLGDAVTQAAQWAARDPRFPPLASEELAGLEVEVSVLSPPRPVAGPEAIVVGTHGVILAKGGARAVFLPQVASEQGWDRETMLRQLARKAGLPADAWRQGARFEVFTAQVCGEGH
jgi:hypothetical protein